MHFNTSMTLERKHKYKKAVMPLVTAILDLTNQNGFSVGVTVWLVDLRAIWLPLVWPHSMLAVKLTHLHIFLNRWRCKEIEKGYCCMNFGMKKSTVKSSRSLFLCKWTDHNINYVSSRRVHKCHLQELVYVSLFSKLNIFTVLRQSQEADSPCLPK